MAIIDGFTRELVDYDKCPARKEADMSENKVVIEVINAIEERIKYPFSGFMEINFNQSEIAYIKIIILEFFAKQIELEQEKIENTKLHNIVKELKSKLSFDKDENIRILQSENAELKKEVEELKDALQVTYGCWLCPQCHKSAPSGKLCSDCLTAENDRLREALQHIIDHKWANEIVDVAEKALKEGK